MKTKANRLAAIDKWSVADRQTDRQTCISRDTWTGLIKRKHAGSERKSETCAANKQLKNGTEKKARNRDRGKGRGQCRMSQVECNKNLFYLLVKWHFYLFAFYAHTHGHTHADRARRSRSTSHTSYAQYADKLLFLSVVSVVYYRIYRMLLFSLLVLSDIFTIFNHLAMQNNWQAFFHLFIFAANNINNKIVDCWERETICEAMRHVYLLMIYSRRARNAGNTLDWFARLTSSSWVFLREFSSVSQRIFTRSIKLPLSPQLALLCQIKF